MPENLFQTISISLALLNIIEVNEEIIHLIFNIKMHYNTTHRCLPNILFKCRQ